VIVSPKLSVRPHCLVPKLPLAIFEYEDVSRADFRQMRSNLGHIRTTISVESLFLIGLFPLKVDGDRGNILDGRIFVR
jgi:hypothetical protein